MGLAGNHWSKCGRSDCKGGGRHALGKFFLQINNLRLLLEDARADVELLPLELFFILLLFGPLVFVLLDLFCKAFQLVYIFAFGIVCLTSSSLFSFPYI